MTVNKEGLEAAEVAFYGRHERGFIARPLIADEGGRYDLAKAIAAYLAAVSNSEERRRRAAGPSEVKWPMPDPLKKYKDAAQTAPDGLVERLRTAVQLATSMGARGQHASNIYNLAEEAATFIQTLQRERDEAKGKLALIVDRIVYSDSYGVPGSDFQCCHLCTGGGAPGVPFEHDERCPIRRVDRDYDQWFEDIRTTEDALRETEDRLAAAEQQVRDMMQIVAEFVQHHDDGPGLIDCIDNRGARYTSQGLADTVSRARLLLKEGGE